MYRSLATLLLFSLLLCSSPAMLHAAPESITVTHTYVMGDSESKNEARAQCLAEAKRKIAEQAGAYVEVLSRTRNFQMDSDEVLSFTAALVRVTVEQEKLAMEGQSLAMTLTVTGVVDPEEVKARLDELAEKRLAAMHGQSPQEEESAQGTPPREPAAPEMEYLLEPGAAKKPAAPDVGKSPRAAKARLEKSLEETTQLCVELTEKGMSRGEVEHLLGRPRAVKANARNSYVGAKYGHVWVVFRDDVVACVRSRLEYRPRAGGEAHCEGFAVNFVNR